MIDDYTPEHMTFTIQSINTNWWIDFIIEMLAHAEWVRNIRVINRTDTSWMLEIIDDEYDTHHMSNNDLLEQLQECWSVGDRRFVHPENIDFDIIDALAQVICFGELVYG